MLEILRVLKYIEEVFLIGINITLLKIKLLLAYVQLNEIIIDLPSIGVIII